MKKVDWGTVITTILIVLLIVLAIVSIVFHIEATIDIITSNNIPFWLK